MSLELFQKTIQKKEGYLITDEYNICYFSHFTGSNGQLLVTQKKAWLLTDFRYLLVAKKVLPKEIQLIHIQKSLPATIQKLLTKNKVYTLFIEGKEVSISRYHHFKKNLDTQLKETAWTGEKFRMIKTESEMKLIIKAQRIAEKVFEQVKKDLKVGKTEEQIRWEIEKLGHDFGADGISFTPIIGFGANSASPHHQNSTKKLRKGDIILVDMGMKFKGYCSDMTRMVFTKPPSTFVEKIYNKVLEAQEEAIKKLRPKVKGAEIDTVARNVITTAGYGKTFGHSLGHGIGLEVHEAPYLSQGYETPLPEGTIVTVEPGIYLENSFGVRIEDMVIIRSEKAENITRSPKKITDCIKNL